MTHESSISSQITEPYYTSLFEALPGSCILLQNDAPRYTVLAATPEYLAQTGYRKEDIIGKGIFEMSPANPDDPTDTGASDLRNSLEYVRLHKEPHQLPSQRYDIAGENGSFSERYWKASNKPVLFPTGDVAYIIHAAEDITNQVKAEKREVQIEGLEKAFGLFMHAPIVVGLVNGEDYVLELANDAAYKLWGKGPEILGKPILQALPELEGQGITELFDQVRTSGEPFIAYEVPVTSLVEGIEEQHYFNLVYQPYNGTGSSKATGVFTISNDVTEQVMARMKVEESFREFRFVTDFLPQLIWLTRPDGYHYYYNKQWYDYTGLTYGETEGEGWNNVFHPEDQERAWRVWRHSLETGEPYQIEYRCRRYDGAYRWFLGRALPLKDDRGAILKWFGTCTDIDDQKRATEVLEQNEAKARLAVESAQLATYEVDLVNQTIAYSPRLAQIYGLDSSKQWPYKTFTDPIHPDDVAIRLKALEESKRTGELFYEVRILRPDNTTRWIRLNGKLKFQESLPLLLVGTVRDITEEKRAAEVLEQKITERTRELEAQKSLLANILTNSSNGISVTEMIKDERGNVVDARTILANDAAVNYIGLPKEIFLSKTAVELDPNILSSSYGQTCLNTLRTGEPALNQYYMEITGRWQELTISKMDDDHLIHIFTDITPIKVAQLQLEQSVEELRRSNVNLEEFAYAASHDLKEPIRKIHIFSDRLKASLKDKLTGEEITYFDRMGLATQRMSALIDDLLLYSHVSRGTELEERVDLNQKVKNVLGDLDLELEEKKATVNVEPLPTIKGHRRQLQQLFHNLIGNAIKYRKQEVAPQIKISCSEVRGKDTGLQLSVEEGQNTFYRITVQDNGIGFAQEDAERIFNVFTRLHGNAEYKGTGVGLSIVRKVVENHKGHIWAESTPGEGASFYVLLPAV